MCLPYILTQTLVFADFYIREVFTTSKFNILNTIIMANDMNRMCDSFWGPALAAEVRHMPKSKRQLYTPVGIFCLLLWNHSEWQSLNCNQLQFQFSNEWFFALWYRICKYLQTTCCTLLNTEVCGTSEKSVEKPKYHLRIQRKKIILLPLTRQGQ